LAKEGRDDLKIENPVLRFLAGAVLLALIVGVAYGLGWLTLVRLCATCDPSPTVYWLVFAGLLEIGILSVSYQTGGIFVDNPILRFLAGLGMIGGITAFLKVFLILAERRLLGHAFLVLAALAVAILVAHRLGKKCFGSGP
jgi:hypothetical protein